MTNDMKRAIYAASAFAILAACTKHESGDGKAPLNPYVIIISDSKDFHDFNLATTAIYRAVERGDTAVYAFELAQEAALLRIRATYRLSGADMREIFSEMAFSPEEDSVQTNSLQMADPCTAVAYSTFALNSVLCLASVSIPVIGEGLVILCTNAAIATLAASVRACSSAK
jgi:hypothetical protein